MLFLKLSRAPALSARQNKKLLVLFSCKFWCAHTLFTLMSRAWYSNVNNWGEAMILVNSCRKQHMPSGLNVVLPLKVIPRTFVFITTLETTTMLRRYFIQIFTIWDFIWCDIDLWWGVILTMTLISLAISLSTFRYDLPAYRNRGQWNWMWSLYNNPFAFPWDVN